MSITAHITLADALRAPHSEVGSLVHNLAILDQDGIAVTPTIVLPKSVLLEIAQANNMSLFWDTLKSELILSDIHHQQVALKKIRSFISSLRIPELYTQAWHSLYELFFKGEYVCVRPSLTSEEQTIEAIPHTNIRGEANLIESILQVWSNHITLSQIHTKSDLVPLALVIQAQPQPIVSGRIWSTHPQTKAKTQILVKASWGVFSSHEPSDTYVVDVRTHQVIKQELDSPSFYLERKTDHLERKKLPQTALGKRVLDASAIETLSILTSKVKHHFLDHIQLEWERTEQGILITNCEKLKNELLPEASFADKLPIVRGTAISGGITEAEIVVIPSTRFITHLPAGKIMVVKKLTHHHLSLLNNACGIICEEYIEHPPLLTEIRQLHIPVIIEARLATVRLKTGQKVILDTTTGAVYPAAITSSAKPAKSITKVLSSLGNTSLLAETLATVTDGVVLRTEFSWLSTGYHPYFVTRNKTLRTALSTQLEQGIRMMAESKKQVWFKLSSFTSQDTVHLPHAPANPAEPNPSFGLRGTVAALEHPEVWSTEVTALVNALSGTVASVKLIIPFVRTSSELGLAIHLLSRSIPPSFKNRVEFFAEIISTAGIVNLSEFMLHPIQGVVLSLPLLQATSMGLDPENSELLKQYPFDAKVASSLLKQAIQTQQLTTRKDFDFVLEMNQLSDPLLQLCAQHTLPAIIVRPTLASAAKKRIMEHEQELIHG